MPDLLKQLRTPQWRDIQFPITARRFGFSQEQSKKRFVFKDQQLIESLGRENPTYGYTIPFREGIAKGGFKALFIEQYPLFLAACEDRTAGILIDPIHGQKRVKCVSFSETLDVNRKDGIDVDVEFIVAPLESEIDEDEDKSLPIKTLDAGRDYSAFLDGEIEKTDWPQQQQPESTQDLFDSINSIGDQISVFQSRVEANMYKLAYECNRTAATIDKLRDPQLATTRRAARKMALGARNLARAATTPPNPVKVVKNEVAIGKLACAAAYNMTVDQFDKYNQRYRRVTLIPVGANIVVPRG